MFHGLNAFGNDIDAASSLGQVASELFVPKSFVYKSTRKLHDNARVASMLEEYKLRTEENIQELYETDNSKDGILKEIKEVSIDVFNRSMDDVCGQAIKIHSERKDMATTLGKTILDAMKAEEAILLNRDVVEEFVRNLRLNKTDFKDS